MRYVMHSPWKAGATMLELIRRCRNCGREVTNEAETPVRMLYCRVCLPERIAKAAAEMPLTRIEHRGNYLIRVPIDRKVG